GLVPALELMLVGGKGQGGAELVVLVALPRRRERIHDAVLDAVEIEVLLALEVEAAAGQATVGRPGVAPRGLGLALGVGVALEIAGALALAVGLQIVPPAIAEIGPQILERVLGMDVAIDDADARFGPSFGLPDFHVHCACSFHSVLRRSALP